MFLVQIYYFFNPANEANPTNPTNPTNPANYTNPAKPANPANHWDEMLLKYRKTRDCKPQLSITCTFVEI